MAESDKSRLPNGGEEMGMTDAQFKAHLLEDLEHWQEALELAVKANDTEVQKKAEKQIAKIRIALEL